MFPIEEMDLADLIVEYAHRAVRYVQDNETGESK